MSDEQAYNSIGDVLTKADERVSVFGSHDYTTHLLPEESGISKEKLVEFESTLKEILDEVWEVYEKKGALYDQATPVWHHFPFGLLSFATMAYLKATRFVSLLQQQNEVDLTEIEDTLKDLVMYTLYAWSYARMVAKGGES